MGMGSAAIEPFAIPEIYADGQTDIAVINGTFRCVLYTMQLIPGTNEHIKVAVMRVIMPAAAIPGAAAEALRAVTHSQNVVSLFTNMPPLIV